MAQVRLQDRTVLEEILKDSKTVTRFPHLLVGNESGDDAAVYELNDGSCLISTTDFFMPIVDDPFTFGKIAACNALSDVYAMGGTPILALAVLGFPVEKIPVEVAQQILRGGKSVCEEAGIPLAGGHSIDSPEPIFGLAVNGFVSKKICGVTTQRRKVIFFFSPNPSAQALSLRRSRERALRKMNWRRHSG